jgi:hypothetical protein
MAISLCVLTNTQEKEFWYFRVCLFKIDKEMWISMCVHEETLREFPVVYVPVARHTVLVNKGSNFYDICKSISLF